MQERKFENTETSSESPEQRLEKRLEILKGKKVIGFEVGANSGNVIISFEGGIRLEFNSWDAYHDCPNLDGVEVEIDKTIEEKNENNKAVK